MLLKGKIALVTGGSKGIGEEIVRKLSKNGATVIFTYKNSRNDAEKLEKELKGVKAYYVDVSITDECKTLCEHIIKEYKKIDIVINNAGISEYKLLMDSDEKDYYKVMNTNFKSVFDVCRFLVPSMASNESGSIVNISSVWGEIGSAFESLYSASKGAINAFTKSISKEIALSGVRVNAISPGFIDTDMNKDIEKEDRDAFLENVSLKRIGTVEDVANVVLFLCSDKAKYITGKIINVDGGMY